MSVVMSYSQEYFSNAYAMNSWDIWSAGFNIFQDEDEDKYIVIGQTGHTLNYNWNQISLMAIDSYGEKLWSYTIGDTICRYFSGFSNSFIKSNTEGYYLCGTKQHYEGSQVHNKGLIAKLSSSYDVLWMREYGDNQLPGDTSDLFNSMIIDEESNIFACGDRIIFTPATDYNKFLCVKLDSLGNVIWKNTYGLDRSNHAYSIIKTSDGGVAIGGMNFGTNNIQSADPVVVKTDAEGNQEWILNLGSEFYDNRAMLCSDTDGIIVATTIADSATPGSDFSFSRIAVSKIDLDGNEIWIKKFGESRKKNHIRSIERIDNQGYIMCGYVRTEPNPWYSSWALRISNNGDSIWYREYSIVNGIDSRNYLYDIRSTDDAGFISCGYIIPVSPDTGNMQTWIIKLDSIGCDIPNCDTTVWLDDLSLSNSSYDLLKVYPNPANEYLNCRLHTADGKSLLLIYDMFGRKQDEMRIPRGQKEIQIDVSAYPAGIYLAVLKNKKRILERRKFVVR